MLVKVTIKAKCTTKDCGKISYVVRYITKERNLKTRMFQVADNFNYDDIEIRGEDVPDMSDLVAIAKKEIDGRYFKNYTMCVSLKTQGVPVRTIYMNACKCCSKATTKSFFTSIQC